MQLFKPQLKGPIILLCCSLVAFVIGLLALATGAVFIISDSLVLSYAFFTIPLLIVIVCTVIIIMRITQSRG